MESSLNGLGLKKFAKQNKDLKKKLKKWIATFRMK